MTTSVIEQPSRVSTSSEQGVAGEPKPYVQSLGEGRYQIDPAQWSAPRLAQIALGGKKILDLYRAEFNGDYPTGVLTPVQGEDEKTMTVSFDDPRYMYAAIQRYLDDGGCMAPDERGIAGIVIGELRTLAGVGDSAHEPLQTVLE